MGQYFKAVNLDKREVVCPWCINGGAKLWEWAVNRQGAIFTFLLCRGAGIDRVDDPPSYLIASADRSVVVAEVRHKSIDDKQGPAPSSIMGRWAGDRVILVGDYDDEFDWSDIEHYTNISQHLVEEWNKFVRHEDSIIKFEHCGCLSPLPASPTAHD